jgi:hypothetical protein
MFRPNVGGGWVDLIILVPQPAFPGLEQHLRKQGDRRVAGRKGTPPSRPTGTPQRFAQGRAQRPLHHHTPATLFSLAHPPRRRAGSPVEGAAAKGVKSAAPPTPGEEGQGRGLECRRSALWLAPCHGLGGRSVDQQHPRSRGDLRQLVAYRSALAHHNEGCTERARLDDAGSAQRRCRFGSLDESQP